jgi:hypothetical protein
LATHQRFVDNVAGFALFIGSDVGHSDAATSTSQIDASGRNQDGSDPYGHHIDGTLVDFFHVKESHTSCQSVAVTWNGGFGIGAQYGAETVLRLDQYNNDDDNNNNGNQQQQQYEQSVWQQTIRVDVDSHSREYRVGATVGTETEPSVDVDACPVGVS